MKIRYAAESFSVPDKWVHLVEEQIKRNGGDAAFERLPGALYIADRVTYETMQAVINHSIVMARQNVRDVRAARAQLQGVLF